MQRDARSYLLDIIDSCDAIAQAIADVDLEAYLSNRLIRSAVEREFIIIGEAINRLSRVSPESFASITQGRHIVDFRNQLSHEYSSVNDTIVWTTAVREAPLLRDECAVVLDALEGIAD
jgi:uncharacterized protein with HEPN domain